jgi:hypothetical protein
MALDESTIAPHALTRLIGRAWHGRDIESLKAWAAAHAEEAERLARRDRRLRILLESWKGSDGNAA